MNTTKPRFFVLALAYLAFISLGLPDGLLGVAWPSIRTYFGLSFDALGPLLISAVIGYMLASFNTGRLLARMSVGTLLALSCFGTALALIGYALAPSWWLVVALGVLAGAGGGAIDTGLNTYAATEFSARTMNWLHASFGIGATAGPLIMTAVLAAKLPWQWGYALVGSVQLVLAACFAWTRGWWQTSAQQSAESTTSNIRPATTLETLKLPVTWLGIAIFVLYCGVEITTGQWSYSLLTEARGVPPTIAGIAVGVYWGALTAGRIVFGVLVSHMSVDRLLRGCLIAIVVGAVALWLNVAVWLSFVGLVVLGFALAPVFPLLITQTPARVGEAHTANAVGFQIAAAVGGGSAASGLAGVLARNVGLEVIGPFIVIVALGLLVLHELLLVMSSKQDRPHVASDAASR